MLTVLSVSALNPQEYLKKNNIKNAVEKVVNAAVKQKALEPYSVMVSRQRSSACLSPRSLRCR